MADDGSKSIKYYNAETRKPEVLISQNVCFLSLTDDETPPEPIMVLPNVLHEGESEESMPLTSGNNGNSLKRKHDDEEEPNQGRTQGKRIDY